MLIVDNKPFTQPVEMISCKWGWMMCPPGDQFVTGSLRLWGVYSETEVELIKRLTLPTDNVLVIGGNIGALAVPVAQHVENLTVFEPQPLIYQLLKGNLGLGGSPLARAVNGAIGVGESTIKVPLVKFDANCNMGIIGKEHWGQGMEVPMFDFNTVLTVDKYDFLVMDVEGMELEILESVEPSLLPKRMWIECDRADTGQALIKRIIDLGFSPYWMINPLTPNGVSPDEGPFPMQASFNLLCLKNEPWPLEGIPQYPATIDDVIGNCPADRIIWNV